MHREAVMETPVVAQYKPYYVDVVAGERYLWCSCGLSKTQPWCDRSHVGTGFVPVAFTAQKTAPVLFCGCKHTRAAPFCDGSHNNLADEYESDPRPLEELLASTTAVAADSSGRASLDDGCYVQRQQGLAFEDVGGGRLAPLIAAGRDSTFLDQYLVELDAGVIPPLVFADAEVVLYGLAGTVEVNIGGQPVTLKPEAGAYLRPGEAFSLRTSGANRARILLTVCPGGGAPVALSSMPANFDPAYATRVVARDDSKRNSMADRFYQVLVGEDIGSREVSQFIGQIPYSKAAPHHHLYEEALVILGGEGVMWTATLRTPVGPGDVIFLPAQLQHSLQCTSTDGLLLAGHFYPAGSPAINY